MGKRYFAIHHWIRREFIYKIVYFISLDKSRSSLLKILEMPHNKIHIFGCASSTRARPHCKICDVKLQETVIIQTALRVLRVINIM